MAEPTSVPDATQAAVDRFLVDPQDFAEVFRHPTNALHRAFGRHGLKLVVDCRASEPRPGLRGPHQTLRGQLIAGELSIHEALINRTAALRPDALSNLLGIRLTARVAPQEENHADDRVHPSLRSNSIFRMVLESAPLDLGSAPGPVLESVQSAPNEMSSFRDDLSAQRVQLREVISECISSQDFQTLLSFDARWNVIQEEIKLSDHKLVVNLIEGSSDPEGPSIRSNLRIQKRVMKALGPEARKDLIEGKISVYDVLMHSTVSSTVSLLENWNLIPRIQLIPIADPHADDQYRRALCSRSLLTRLSTLSEGSQHSQR